MARLFTAIELTDAVRDAVVRRQAAIVSALRMAGDRGLRAVRAPQLHLTLVFIGEVPDAQVPAVTAALGEPVPMPGFDVAFGGPGVFPTEGAPRVLWLGVPQGGRELAAVHDLVVSRLQALGIETERRPFAPHLTLGRWRDRAPARLRMALPQADAPIVQRVMHVTVFQSHLRPGAPEHDPLVRAPLA